MAIVIALDFDGTLVEHAWPDIGKDIGAFKHLIWLQQELKVKYILWTVRSDRPLQCAIWHCWGHGLKFWGINRNPTQHTWSTSPKAHADIFVDDAALGTPLIWSAPGIRPYVDWDIMNTMLYNHVQFLESNKPKYYKRGK